MFNTHTNRYTLNGFNPLEHVEFKQESLTENTDFLNQAKPLNPSRYNEKGESVDEACEWKGFQQ